MTLNFRFSLLAALLSGALTASSPSAAPAAANRPATTGLLVGPSAFQAVTLPRSTQNDKIRDALGYGDDDPVRVFDQDLNDDGKPERFIVGAEKTCGSGGCPYTVLDGKTARDIGGFFGNLIVLYRHENGWAVIQTLGRDEGGQANLTSYVFNRAQYQPEDAALIDEVAQHELLKSLSRRP